MKNRKYRKETDWNNRLDDTLKVLSVGESYAMNAFRKSTREDRVKLMNDMTCMIDAPERSEVSKICSEKIGKNYKEVVGNVYRYGKTINSIRNKEAC